MWTVDFGIEGGWQSAAIHIYIHIYLYFNISIYIYMRKLGNEEKGWHAASNMLKLCIGMLGVGIVPPHLSRGKKYRLVNVSICSLARALREYDEAGNVKNQGALVNSAGFKAGMSVRRSKDKTVPFRAVQSMGSTCK